MQKIFVIVLCCMAALLNAQDKFFLSNGTIKTGILLSIGRDYVFYKATDTSATVRLEKKEVVMVEDYKGNIHAIGLDEAAGNVQNNEQITAHRNIFSLQPLNLFMGRGTAIYERLNAKGNIGVAIPFIVSFKNPLWQNAFNNAGSSTTGIITGLDINFYFKNRENERQFFFIGPRFRYGTDVSAFRIEAFTTQTQFGWRFGGSKGFVQHVSVGVGFVKILSANTQLFTSDATFHSWYSINYQIGLRW